MKSAREKMDMIAAYVDVGTYRGAAAICGTNHHTVKREVLRRLSGADGATAKQTERAKNTDVVGEVVARRVKRTHGRISAKRLLPAARADGYTGSARNFRRLVANAKNDWRAEHHRGRRPAVWTPGQTLVIDWGTEDGLHVFCAVSAWSRWRFVRFAVDECADTTLALLAEGFEAMGGVPKVVLADRMGCLKGGVVANVVVPSPAYVRFAAHYLLPLTFAKATTRLRWGSSSTSSATPRETSSFPRRRSPISPPPTWPRPPGARRSTGWCTPGSARCPTERLATERSLFSLLPSLRPRIGKAVTRKVDRLACVRFGSARYSVPMALIGKLVEVVVGDDKVRVVHLGIEMALHDVVAPGAASVKDERYGGPRPMPTRAPRPRSAAEHALIGLGEAGIGFLKGAAAAGATKLGSELGAIVALEHPHGRDALVAALVRATAFGRWRLEDLRSILDAGLGAPRPAVPGQALIVDLPVVPVRPLSAYAPEEAR